MSLLKLANLGAPKFNGVKPIGTHAPRNIPRISSMIPVSANALSFTTRFGASTMPKRFFTNGAPAVAKRPNRETTSPAVSRWSPFNEFDIMNDMRMPMLTWGFEDMFPSSRLMKTETEWRPKADLVESKDAYSIHAELPGVSKENVKVSLEENLLTIKGTTSLNFAGWHSKRRAKIRC